MNFMTTAHHLNRLSSKLHHRTLFTSSWPDLFQATPILCKAPLKKKKKLDPAILKAGIDRKKRRLEKEIKKLEKNTLQFKPIDEMEISSEIKNSIELRTRPSPNLTDDELYRRHEITKQWNNFRLEQNWEEVQLVKRLLETREKALNELKAESEDLYYEAIQLDLSLIPFRCKGPVNTPPIEGFDIDGDYKDVTRKWD